MQIFRAGTHTDSRGRTLTFSAADIEATAAAYAPEVHEAPLVVGHPALDDPAYGWVESLAATGGGVLEASPRQVDPAFAEMVAEGRFKRVSASFYAPDAHANPVPGVWYLRHVGFLGAHPPAVKGLRPVMFAAAGAVDGLVTIEFATATTREDAVIPATDPASPVLAELVKERAALDEARKQLDAERERLNAERAQFAEAAAAAAAAKRLEDAGKIVDAAVGAGQILPTFRSQLVAFVAHLDDGEAVSFGEDGDKQTPAAWFANWLKSLPGIIHYREVAGGAEAVAARARAGADMDPKDLATQARRKMAQEAFGGSLDPRDAVQAVLWSCLGFVDTRTLEFLESMMAKKQAPYAPEFRRQMIELVRAGRTPNDPPTTRCEDIRLVRVEATGGKGSSGYGFDPHENVLRLSFLDCLAHDNELDGFVIDGCREVIVTGCRSWENGRHGYNIVTWSSDVVISASQAMRNTENGFIVQNGGQHVCLRDCISKANGYEGVKIRGEDAYTHNNHVSVTGCQITENGRRGVAIAGSRYNTIAHNVLLNNSASLDNGYDDINLTIYETGPASQNSVLFNICRNTTLDKRTRYSIREESTTGYCDNNYLVGNRCSGAVNGTPQSFNGTDTFVFSFDDDDKALWFGRSSSNRFFLEDSGRLRWGSANAGLTVGVAGAAAAPPATPQIYLEVEDSAQNRLLVPAYLKAV